MVHRLQDFDAKQIRSNMNPNDGYFADRSPAVLGTTLLVRPQLYIADRCILGRQMATAPPQIFYRGETVVFFARSDSETYKKTLDHALNTIIYTTIPTSNYVV